MNNLKAKFIHLIGSIPIIGNILRRYARNYQEGSIVTISSGYAKGMKWRRFLKYPLGFHLGIYEPEMQTAIAKNLKPGSVFYDIGANAGFFGLIASKLMGEQGEVYCFDPVPENVAYIRDLFSINELNQGTVIEMAVGCKSGIIKFKNNGRLETRKIADLTNTNCIDVSIISLDDFICNHRPPNLIKVDVEGAETDVIEGAAKMLSSGYRPTWIIELHSNENAYKAYKLLSQYGYSFYSLSGKQLTENNLPRHIIAMIRQSDK